MKVRIFEKSDTKNILNSFHKALSDSKKGLTAEKEKKLSKGASGI